MSNVTQTDLFEDLVLVLFDADGDERPVYVNGNSKQ